MARTPTTIPNSASRRPERRKIFLRIVIQRLQATSNKGASGLLIYQWRHDLISSAGFQQTPAGHHLRCASKSDFGTFRTWRDVRLESVMRSRADVAKR